MLGGLTLTLYGVLHNEVPHSLSGVGAIMIALTLLVLLVIHKWVTDTRAERELLAASQRETQAERSCYIAAQAALVNERSRMRRDLDDERAAILMVANREREALLAEFEENRARLVCETMEATVRMFHNGKFAPDTRRGGTLIQFPNQHPQTQRNQPREHGVGRP
jgi:hypothetical protein